MKSIRAFTLIEVLVATAVTVLIAGSLLAVTANVLNLWNRSGGLLTAGAEAGVVLDQLALDLEALVQRADDHVWLAATVQRDQTGTGDAGMSGTDWPAASKPRGNDSLLLTPNSGRIEDARFGQAGVWLRFFSTQPDANDSANNRSAPRAVAYQIVRRRVGDRYHYQLYRSQVRPGGANSTFTAGYHLFSPVYVTGNGQEQHPGNVRRPNARFLIGNHVVDFGVRVYTPTSDGNRLLVFPLTNAEGQSFAATTDPEAFPPGYGGRPVTRGQPHAFEVMVRILTEEGARLIWNLESGRVPVPPGSIFAEHWWQLAEKHSHIHVRQIVPRAAGL